MATKIPSRRAPAPPVQPEHDIEVLHPERDVLLSGGRKLHVREYGHVEWLRLLPLAEPLVKSIADALDAGRDPSYEEALDCLARHIDALAPLIAQACGMAVADYEALNPSEGELVLMTWWGVNGRFFVDRALNRVMVGRTEQSRRAALLADHQAGARSTPA